MENCIREQVARVPAVDLERVIEKVKARLKTLGRRGRVLRQNLEKKKALLASKKRTGEQLLATAVALEEEERSCQGDLESYVGKEQYSAEEMHQLNMESLQDLAQDGEMTVQIVDEGTNGGELACAYAVNEITEGALEDVLPIVHQLTDDCETTEGNIFGIGSALDSVEADQKARDELNSGIVLLIVSPFEIELPDERSGV